MEAELAVVWLVMDNSAYGTIAGLEKAHYGTEFGCLFERRRPALTPWTTRRWRDRTAPAASGFGAADELGPALREALASGMPTVIQAEMENAPTPTPGHWNINDIYRKGD